MTPSSSLGPEIDLIFDEDCPHVNEARRLLHVALMASGLPPQWREWKRDAADTPPPLRSLGSPTIVVDGKDVSTGEPTATDCESANSCRIYHDGRELRGVPPLDAVTRALASTRSR
jgi:hypothetical protein